MFYQQFTLWIIDFDQMLGRNFITLTSDQFPGFRISVSYSQLSGQKKDEGAHRRVLPVSP